MSSADEVHRLAREIADLEIVALQIGQRIERLKNRLCAEAKIAAQKEQEQLELRCREAL